MRTPKFLEKLKSRRTDSIEEDLKTKFSFLLVDYGFEFSKTSLGNAVNKEGKFFFYGPLYCYSIYNPNICVNILYLVQRQEFDIYITKEFCKDQVYIRNGICGLDQHACDLTLFARDINKSIKETGKIYGQKI